MPARTTGRRDADEGGGDATARLLREHGAAVAGRELETALAALDDPTPAERRALAAMADRIAVGVLAPWLAALEDADAPPDETVRRLFDLERVRDRT